MILFLKMFNHALAAMVAFVPAVTVVRLILPRYFRGGTFFGVHVPVGFAESDAGQAILKQFRRTVWSCSALAAVASLLFPVNLAFLPSMFIASLAGSVALTLANRRTRREAGVVLTSTVRVASLAPEMDAEPWWLNPLDLAAMLVPPLLPAVTLTILAVRWNQLTPKIQDGFGVFGVFFGLALGLMCTGNHWALRYRARSSDWAPSPAASHKFRTCLGAMQALVFTFITSQICVFELMRLTGRVNMPIYFLIAFPAQGAWLFYLRKIQRWLTSQMATGSIDPMPDTCWKWGWAYFNPGDPALMVPSRMGVAQSPNWARPSVWIVYGAVTVLTVASLTQTVRGMLRLNF